MIVRARIELRALPEIEAVLYGLTLASAWQIRNAGAPRDFYAAGCRYVRESRGRDDWQTWLDTARLKTGDCEDLSVGLAACLWVGGDSKARAIATPIRPGLIHIRVRHGNGRIEDPSKKLGMRPRK